MGEELNIILNRIYVFFNIKGMGDTENIFFDILLRKAKKTFVGIANRPKNSITFLECFDKHLDDINLDNAIILLGDYNANFSHSVKYSLKGS